MDIKNYVKVSEQLHTSGQPLEHEFARIASMGIRTLINLAMPDSDTAIANEGQLVTAQGMNYVHIPVVWKDPKPEQFDLFCAILAAHPDDKVWVHCALNWRVSTFVYLYKRKALGVSHDDAWPALLEVWDPNQDWLDFIEQVA